MIHTHLNSANSHREFEMEDIFKWFLCKKAVKRWNLVDSVDVISQDWPFTIKVLSRFAAQRGV